jgi:hypothetical protein
MLAKTGSYILKNLRPKFPSPLRCMPAFRFWMEPQVSNELQGRPSHPPGRHSRLTGPHRLSQRCSEHLVDLSAPLDPFEEVDNVLRKLRLCGVLASKVLKTLGLGESSQSPCHKLHLCRESFCGFLCRLSQWMAAVGRGERGILGEGGSHQEM